MRRCTVYNTVRSSDGTWRGRNIVRFEGWLLEVHKRSEYTLECLVADEHGVISCHGADYVRVHVPVMLDLLTGRPAAPHGTPDGTAYGERYGIT